MSIMTWGVYLYQNLGAETEPLLIQGCHNSRASAESSPSQYLMSHDKQYNAPYAGKKDKAFPVTGRGGP
jgi:hypothetical protein